MYKIDYNKIQNPEEKQFIRQIQNALYLSEAKYRESFTDFYHFDWMQSVYKKYLGDTLAEGLTYFGGYEGAERQILGCAPFELSSEDFPISCLKVIVKTGIGKALSHRDYLGALLGLGIERDKIGDIIVKSFGAYVIVSKVLVDYIMISLTGIGRYQNIEIISIPFSEIEMEAPQTKCIETTVASLRLDVLTAAGLHLSRSAVLKLIAAGKVKCNGMETSGRINLKEGDHVTVRGYGKIKLSQVNGLTKKDRIHVVIEKYV